MQVKAYAALGPKKPLAPFPIERRAPGKKDLVIEISHCGICHSDIHQARDEWGGSTFPMVPGHEIVGKVIAVGSEAKKFSLGALVGVGCMVDSCRKCSSCERHLEQFCAEGASFTYNGFERDRKTVTQGGYSQKIVVQEDFVLRMPENLSPAGAAPLLCAGITLYSPLKHWKAGPGKKVAIVGLGGLGHMGVKIARAMGAHVSVLSHSPKKEKDALALGAHEFLDTSKPETFEKNRGRFDLIINTVSASIDWNAYLGLVALEGNMVLVGVPTEPVPVGAFSLIGGRKSLSGSLIGGIQETQEMLDFCGKHKIESQIELIPIQAVNNAYERILQSDVKYRFVIDMKSLE